MWCVALCLAQHVVPRPVPSPVPSPAGGDSTCRPQNHAMCPHVSSRFMTMRVYAHAGRLPGPVRGVWLPVQYTQVCGWRCVQAPPPTCNPATTCTPNGRICGQWEPAVEQWATQATSNPATCSPTTCNPANCNPANCDQENPVLALEHVRTSPLPVTLTPGNVGALVEVP